MTLPYERYWALKNALRFFWDLIDRSKTKRVPKEIRTLARSCLKHFPHEYEIDAIAEACEAHAKATGMREPVVEKPERNGFVWVQSDGNETIIGDDGEHRVTKR